MSALWSNGESRASRSPMTEHHSPGDFESDMATIGPSGEPAHGGLGMFGGGDPMGPHISVSKFDGRPLLGPGQPGYGGGRGPPHFEAPHGIPEHQSVSAFDGRPLGPGAHGPWHVVDGPPHYPPGPPVDGHTVPFGGHPFQTQYYGAPQHHHEPNVLEDCYGAGRSFWDVVKALVTGQRRRPAADGVCFYDAGPSATFAEGDPRWDYPGYHTQGYEEVAPYRYEGFGPRHDMMHPPLESRWRMRPTCALLLGVAAVFAVVALLFGLIAQSTKAPFNCNSDLADEARGWSFEKKAWCCENQKKGCGVQQVAYPSDRIFEDPETLPPTTTTTTVTRTWAEDCAPPKNPADVLSWSPGRTAYCCLHAGVGCPTTTTDVPYDCAAGFLTFDMSWGETKKAWCCMHQRVGCPSHKPGVQPPVVAPDTLPDPPKGSQHYDCDKSLHNAEVSWSLGKKAYCCEYFGKGCPTVPSTTSEMYDCWAGYANWQGGWSLQKKLYCCQRAGRGCSERPLPTPPSLGCDTNCRYKDEDSSCKSRISWLVDNQRKRCLVAHSQVIEECPVCGGCDLSKMQCKDPGFDCAADYHSFENKWSVEQRAWCCGHEGKSCVPDNNFDCDAGFWNWAKGWSLDKKVYCCTHRGKACEEGRPKDYEFDCSTGFEVAWSATKKASCCQMEGKGCTTGFDCGHGEDKSWEPDKKQYCCAKFHKGCEGAARPYDCDAGASSWKVGWSVSKKSWCCQHKGKGCEKSFDCDAGFDNWQRGWASEKKEWCCTHHSKACEKAFDCKIVDALTEQKWNEEQKGWCCEHEGRGCGKGSVPHDCSQGLSNWKLGWSDAKKKWCCDKAGKGCEPKESSFDCNAAWGNWEMAWSSKKKEYCCEKVERACKPFDCGSDVHTAGWHVQKVQWCCINENIACSAGAR